MCKGKDKGQPTTSLCRHRGVLGVQLQPICNLSARKEWVVSTLPQLLNSREDPVPTAQVCNLCRNLKFDALLLGNSVYKNTIP